MEKLQFDSGVKSYKVGAGVIRFNPADPNVFARFTQAAEKMQSVQDQLLEKARDGKTDTVQLLWDADQQMKKLLSWVFGEDNDFDRILGGINLLAMASNGQRVIGNLLDALQPVLLDGARQCAAEKKAERDGAQKK